LSRSYAYLRQEKLAFSVSKLEEACHNFVEPGDTKKRACSCNSLTFSAFPAGFDHAHLESLTLRVSKCLKTMEIDIKIGELKMLYIFT
jgi:hypothetical protein